MWKEDDGILINKQRLWLREATVVPRFFPPKFWLSDQDVVHKLGQGTGFKERKENLGPLTNMSSVSSQYKTSNRNSLLSLCPLHEVLKKVTEI